MGYMHLVRASNTEHVVRYLGHPPHQHPEPQLIFVVSGSGRLDTEGRTHILATHQAAWLPPMTEHAFSLSDDGLALGPLLNHYSTPPGNRTLLLANNPELTELCLVLLAAGPETETERAPFQAALGSVLQRATAQFFALTLPEHPIARDVALEAADFEGTLPELADRHYTSVRHIQRLFVEETGLSFATWRTRARLNRAVTSLRSGHDLRTAMARAGYATKFGLLKALSRECGIPLAALHQAQSDVVACLDAAS